jgi:hypothetical protein
MKRQNQVVALLMLLVALALGGAAGERTAAAAAPEPRVLEVTSSAVEGVDLTRTEPAVMAEHAMQQPSVAAFRQLSKTSFRTSVNQEIRLTARVAPGRLASRLEWRVLAGQRLLGVLRGGEVRIAFSRPGRYQGLRVIPPARCRPSFPKTKCHRCGTATSPWTARYPKKSSAAWALPRKSRAVDPDLPGQTTASIPIPGDALG